MKQWFNENKTAVFMATLTIITATCIFLLQGCNLAQWIPVAVPPEVAQVADLPEGKMTLAEADAVWKEWTAYVENNSEQFKAAVADAEERYVFYNSVISTGLGLGEGALGSFPAGAFLLTLLGGTTGLFLKRPKEDSRVAEEKMASYNKGIEIGKKIAEEALKGNKTDAT